MADVSATFTALLLDWLFWWAILTLVEWSLIYGLDSFLTECQRRQEARRQLREEFDRIDRDTYASIDRIGIAYAAAQQLLRDEVMLNRGDRR